MDEQHRDGSDDLSWLNVFSPEELLELRVRAELVAAEQAGRVPDEATRAVLSGLMERGVPMVACRRVQPDTGGLVAVHLSFRDGTTLEVRTDEAMATLVAAYATDGRVVLDGYCAATSRLLLRNPHTRFSLPVQATRTV